MNKREFLLALKGKLSDLPQRDIDECLAFYSEMIDDRVEEGLSENEAVLEIGSIDEVANKAIAEVSIIAPVKEKNKPKSKLKTWEIILLVLGSPVWLSLLISAFAVMLSLFVCLWCIIISLWAVFASLAACGIGGIAAGIGFIVSGNTFTGIAMVGAALVCAGLCIFVFFVCKMATKGMGLLTKKTIIGIKNCFIKKEKA